MTINILFITGDLDVGGTEIHLSQILSSLQQSGLRPIVYTLTHKGQLAPKIEATGIEVIAPPNAVAMRRLPGIIRPLITFPITVVKLIWIMRRRNPDIVHFFLPAAYLIGGLCSLVSDVPVRIMSRRSLATYQRKRLFVTWLERRLHQRMTAVLGNSQAVVAELADEGVPTHKLGLVYNGLDLNRFENRRSREQVRAETGLDEGDLVITIVANLIPYKGHTDLLDALGTIKHQLPENWVLFCVGHDTGIGKGLKERADQLGIGNAVHWLKQRHDVPDILCASDIGVLSSHEEGFANSILEGMAAGLPMVVTDVGGNAEAVVDGMTGLVVKPRDQNSLGAAILKLAHQPELRRAMGKNGRQRVEKEFSLDRCVANYKKLYTALCSTEHKPVAEILSAD